VLAVATKIRLMRLGRKKRPFYRVVVADSRARRDGRFVDILGYYNPLVEPAEIPTDTVKNILSKLGLIKKFAEEKAAK
jgi:small subunit ribosomal protein S16